MELKHWSGGRRVYRASPYMGIVYVATHVLPRARGKSVVVGMKIARSLDIDIFVSTIIGL